MRLPKNANGESKETQQLRLDARFRTNLPALAAVGKRQGDGIYFTDVDVSVTVVGQVMGSVDKLSMRMTARLG